MVKTAQMLYENLSEYAEPAGKVKRLVQTEKLIPIIQSKYETDSKVPGYCLAPVIYGPSYLSFDFALAWHSLIPEKVYTFTSATCLKGRKKKYTNFYGTYTYRDVPRDAYPFEINIVSEGGYTFFIASGEKALCDKLSELPPCRNTKELSVLLFENLRIDRQRFGELNYDTILKLCDLYKMTNLKLLKSLIRRMSK